MPMAGIFMGMALEELDDLGMAAAEVVAAYGHDGIILLLEACCRLETECIALLRAPFLLHLPYQEVLEDRPEPESTDAIFAEHAGCPLEAAYHALDVAVAGKRLREAYIEALERSDAQDKRALLCRMRCKDAPLQRDEETQLRGFQYLLSEIQYLLSEIWMRSLDAVRTFHLVHRKLDHERVALGALRQNLCILRRDIDASLMAEVHNSSRRSSGSIVSS